MVRQEDSFNPMFRAGCLGSCPVRLWIHRDGESRIILGTQLLPSDHFSSLSKSLWTTIQPFVVPTTLSSFIWSEKLLSTDSFPPPWLTKLLNSIESSINCLGTLLGTTFQLLFELLITGNFQSTLLSTSLAHASSACLWGYYGRQYQKPHQGEDKLHSLLPPHAPKQPSHYRNLSGFSCMIFPS